MKNRKDTIRRIVDKLNNREEEGGFWLPNIQRPFVWGQDRICRLYDSILREYPISTLLVWKTKAPIRRRKFIDNWQDGMRLNTFYVPKEDDSRKVLVLDGQQRLQSLYIGLCGSFNGQELHLDILSGDLAATDDVRYRFEFLDPSKAVFPWVKVKGLVFTDKSTRQLAKALEDGATQTLSPEQKDRLDDNLDRIARTFRIEETVTYQELDSIDSPDLYREDDVVEIFIRANSGGTPLGKSDLLFSLLAAGWDTADKAMDDLLVDLNQHGYNFTRDFVLKTCLSLLDQGARYEIRKFRKAEVKKRIETEWPAIADALRDVQDFLYGETFLKCDKAIPSYLALIPLVYLRFHFPDAWKRAAEGDARTFLLRTLLAGAFGLAPDQLIDECVRKIHLLKGFDLNELLGVVGSVRKLHVTEDRFWGMGYDSDSIHLLFNLWYNFNYVPSYPNNRPQVDHIFPKSRLRQIKVANEAGHLTLMKYRQADQNQLANCMLLTAEENGSGGKTDKTPKEWFTGKPESYLDLHLIPKNPALWEMDQFDAFIAARKVLLRRKFGFVLAQDVAAG